MYLEKIFGVILRGRIKTSIQSVDNRKHNERKINRKYRGEGKLIAPVMYSGILQPTIGIILETIIGSLYAKW